MAQRNIIDTNEIFGLFYTIVTAIVYGLKNCVPKTAFGSQIVFLF